MKPRLVMFFPYVSPKAMEAVADSLRGRWIGQGPKVANFEDRIRQVTGAPYVVAVNCASAATRLALAVSGVGPGDEVITTAQTCTATNHPILEQFARPVFADIQYMTGNLAPADIEHRITPRTKAIICVHWGGFPCDLDEIRSIAARYNLALIEGAEDALGASYNGRPVGCLSYFTVFSFGAVQQVTTGEGGALCMLEERGFEAARRRRWYGIDRLRRTPNVVGYYDFEVSEVGYGYHMTDIQASMGLVHLDDLPEVLRRRGDIAKLYRHRLMNVPGVTLLNDNRPDRSSGYQLFTIHVERREDFCRMMQLKGVEVSVVHVRNDQYDVFGGLRSDLPELDHFSKSHISLPLHSNLSEEDAAYVVDCIREGW